MPSAVENPIYSAHAIKDNKAWKDHNDGLWKPSSNTLKMSSRNKQWIQACPQYTAKYYV